VTVKWWLPWPRATSRPDTLRRMGVRCDAPSA
jgi:hypothetical protein